MAIPTHGISVKYLFMFLAMLCALVMLGIRVEWSINLDSGLQTYERSLWGVPITALSEYNYSECPGRWSNPDPVKTGSQLLSSCSVFGCNEAEVRFDVIHLGCNSS